MILQPSTEPQIATTPATTAMIAIVIDNATAIITDNATSYTQTQYVST